VRAAALLGLLLASSLALAAQPDPVALADAARRILGADQGVYVESADGTILLAQAAQRAVHPASVSKIPTTLALLRKFGDQHRFVTTFSSAGEVRDGVLRGDLVVAGGGDPYLVDENALLVAARLRDQGITRIDGRLRATGPLVFNWITENAETRLQRALSGVVSAPARLAVSGLIATASAESLPTGLPFTMNASRDATAGLPTGLRPLVIHRSQPLLRMLKQLNDYSNNIFKPLADAAGGAAAVQALARSILPSAMQSEIVLGDGAGTDRRNRMSPRVAVRLLRALESDLQAHGHTLADALPVSGIDEGTLKARLNEPGEAGHVAGKTGTFGDYGACALIGAFNTREHGMVYFAILNHGVPILRARRQQDAMVRTLLRELGSLPWEYRRDARPAVTQAEVVAARPL